MSGAGPWVIPLLFAASATGLGYLAAVAVREGLENYGVYAQDTARQYEDLFLFIPAHRIATFARVSAGVLFVLLFLLVGGFTDASLVFRGTFFGVVGALAALFAPKLIVRILRRRRLNRFNLQLLDALSGMSSAIKAGFSILQAFESVVKQGLNPIAQEFGLFLHQVRVGVKFEEALRNMEERVGSEDLSLMNQSIEIARQTGGNLTEVFDKIGHTIRERMRIEQRIRSLTAQGRLQGLVVGSMPIILMVLMTMWYPKMMMPFFYSKIGIAVLILVGVLEVFGFIVIRKIVMIKV